MDKIKLDLSGTSFASKSGQPVKKLNLSGTSFEKKNPNEPINPSPSQTDMVSSGAKPSTDGTQDDDSWYDKTYSFLAGVGKNILDTTPLIAKGLLRQASKAGMVHSGGVPSSLIAEAVNGKEAGKQMEEIQAISEKNALKGADQLIPYEKQKLAKGTSSITELYGKGYMTSGDAENVGYQVADGLMQMGIGAIPAVGGMLLYSKNLESRYEDAKAKGFSDDKAFNESAVGALVETVIEKNIGVDKWISKGLGKTLSKEAIKDISGALLTKEAFQEAAKKYAKSFSLENIKQGFVKGFLPEAAEEFAQTYIDGAEQDLFDYYERKRKEGDPNAKLALYDAKDEEGIFNTVNPETGKPELTPSFKSKTLFGALDASFYGGITGQMGGMFVDSRSFNPSIYSTLQNAYDSQGKEALAASAEKIRTGLSKASQDGKLEVESYNNALKNVDKIANNIAKFEQNSDINSYSRYVLYDHTERIIPQTANRIARTLAEASTPLQLPTQDQIEDNIKNNEVAVIPFQQENQVPEPYKPYTQVMTDSQGNKSIEASVPNSVVEAYNTNQAAIQTAMNNPLFAVDSLTNNNKLVTIEDLQRIGQQGGVQGDLASQLNFNIIFEANKKNFEKSLRVINYAKSVSNNIAGGQQVEAADLRQGYINIAAYNTGETVFYNNKSAKIMEMSPDGQSFKLSGVQQQVSANDENLRLRDSATEQAIQPQEEQPTAETATVEQSTAPAEQAPVVREPLAEEEQITGRTMRDAVGELIPFTLDGETGKIYTTNSGVVTFESPNKVVEFGNIKDVGDMSIDSFGIVPQEMSIGGNYSVTIDGKTFTNKNQNPFKAITYDADGNAVSIKLENEKGQTRVIKGTRAVVIEAKYKVKQLFDESTRDQLAAAAEDAANQAAAIEDTRGQSPETPTPTESKPVEQAPTIAERERIKRVREIAQRLAAEETEQMTENRKSVANLASSLFSAGIPVEVLNSEAIRIKYGKDVPQGMFLSKDGTVVINEDTLASEWGKTIIFHEGTHPIINIIRNTEPKLYKQLVAAIKEEAKFNPEVNKILQQINASDAYPDEFTRNDELVVEAIARLASGKLKLNNIKPTLRQALVNFLNKIAKTLGFNQILNDSDQVAFNKLANQISEVLNAGRDISEIVGSRNVGKFNNSDSGFVNSDGNRLTNGDVQFSLFNELTDVETGFSHQYLKDSNDFIKLVNEGIITDDKILSDFEGRYLFFHAPDSAFSGNLLKDGKVVIKGQGGLFYPILNYAKKLLWASTSTASDKLVKYFNENAKLNDGRIYFGLVSTDPNKLLSSTTASVGVMDLFLEKAKDSSFAITEDKIKRYLADAFKGKTVLIDKKKGNKVVQFKDVDESKLSGDLNSIRDYIESRLSPDNSSFDDRKYFVHRFLDNVAKSTKDYSILAKQLGEFFHIKMENEAFKGKHSKGYKISKANLIDNVSNILTEPLLKGQETGGKVYAVIEVSLKDESDKSNVDFDNIVSSIKSDSHKSYPDAIKINDDRFELKVHILQDRKEWFDNSLNSKTNSIVGKSKSTSVMPTTAGITMGSVKLATQMSDIQRENVDKPQPKKETSVNDEIQFSDLSRDDKRIQTIRRDFASYPKSEIVDALMSEPFNLSKEKAENLVARAFYDPLAPSLPTGNPDTAIPKGSTLNQKAKTVEEYNEGYDKAKRALLEESESLWDKTKKYIALQYDSRFFARRKLGLASSSESLAQAKLRNLNGIAYSASQELAQHFENIFGNGLEETGIANLDAMIFNLRILQIDKNTEAAYQDAIEQLTLSFMEANGRMPSQRESESIARTARVAVPMKSHGKTKNGQPATSETAKAFLEGLRNELGENEYNMLNARADLFRKVGNEQVEKLRKAGIISEEVAKQYKDDFYAFRMTLDRLFGETDPSILVLNGVPNIKGWASLSKEGTENYISQDSRLMLAQSYLGTARAIAKNAFREAVFSENISVDKNGVESSVRDLNGNQITFIKPANYIRDNQGNIRSNGKELSVREAEAGYVNVPFKKDGVVHYFQMEAETFEQIEGNNIVWKDGGLKSKWGNAYYWTTDQANRILTAFATRKNPFFFIGNVPMDLQQQVFFTDIWTEGSLVQSNVYSAGARAIARTIKFSNFFGLNTDFVDKTLEEYIAAGGAMDRMSTMKEQRQRSIDLSLVGHATDSKGKLIKEKIKSVAFGMNERTEIAMRLAAYDQSKKNLIKKFEEDNNGAKPNEAQMLRIQEIAAAKSRAYTDFAQRGTSLPNLNVAYLNSSIQAAGAAAEYVYDNPVKATEKLSQLVIGKFLGTMAIMALMGDAYDDLDEYRKDMYSFLFSWDTGKKDANGKPIYVTADVRNNPTLIPLLGVSRTMAEKTMRALQGKEQEDVTVLGTADRFFDLINQASPIPVPNVTSIAGLRDSMAKLFTKHIFFNAAAKMIVGYDAFKGRDIISERDKDLSPYMRGQDDPNIPYFYKVMARSMSSFSSDNQISPATMQSVAETFITSPRTNVFVALGYGVLSDAANVIVEAKTDKERGEFSLWDSSKALKSITARVASFTDSEKAQFRKNEELYILGKEESMKYNDQERIIDNRLKDLHKEDVNNFFKNVDAMAKQEGYWDNIPLMERIDRKAAALDKGEFSKSFVKADIANEVRILHYTKGAEGKSRLLKYMFDNDKEKARMVIDGLIDYGTSVKEAYDTEDLYLKMIK